MQCPKALTAIWISGALCAACATQPALDLEGVDIALTPAMAVTTIDSVRGHRVEWGGVIVSAKNLHDHTELEVLAYPLNRSAHPKLEKQPLGRFVVEKSGYLETLDYAPGRLLTAVGPLTGVREGSVGETPYRFAVMNAEQLRLWPAWTPGGTGPQIHFGVGILYSR